ncbi:MAG: hypothetical protein JWP38_3681 [Herbaspirillum sp.]|nr:hypothetical protein [Herbaspirillum sp.]
MTTKNEIDIEAERKLFEAWASTEKYRTIRNGDFYTTITANHLWEGWLAAKRAALIAAEPALIVELVDVGNTGKPHIRKWDNPGGLTVGVHRLYSAPPAPAVATVPLSDADPDGWIWPDVHHYLQVTHTKPRRKDARPFKYLDGIKEVAK